MSPWRWWCLYRPGQIELELDVPVLAAHGVDEALAWNDLHGPDIGARLRAAFADEQVLGKLIDGKVLAGGGAGAGSVAAILGDSVFAAVCVAVVVLQAQAGAGLRDDPSTGAVFGHMQRDGDAFSVALAHMHHHGLASQIGVARVSRHHGPGKGLAAKALQIVQECRLRAWRWRGCTSAKQGCKSDGKVKSGIAFGHTAFLRHHPRHRKQRLLQSYKDMFMSLVDWKALVR